jgi:microsomal dipeptidase-like Zn-dependent dipeptidase
MRKLLLLGVAALIVTCTKRPEAVQQTLPPETPGPSLKVGAATLRGFADLHDHQFNHLAFGGQAIIGDPAEPSPQALKDCWPYHAPWGTNDLMERFHPARCGNYSGHWTNGNDRFEGWPRWNTYSHQQVHEEWLKRAWLGGLRLMVMMAGNSPDVCRFTGKAPGRDCDDMNAVDLELKAARAFEEQVDREAGWSGLSQLDGDAVFHGDRPGWYRLVYTAGEAYDTMQKGKLAVVLGIEVPGVFGCTLNGACTPDTVTAAVVKYHKLGVRHVFPIHSQENAFGGPAIFNGGQAEWLGLNVGPDRDCSADGYLYERPYFLCGPSTGRVTCSATGLTDPLGKHVVNTLIDHAMFVDVDHMSAWARRDALDIAEARHAPVMSSHSDFVEVSVGTTKNEAALTNAEIRRIAQVGGLIAPVINPGPMEEVDGPRDGGEPRVESDCIYSREWVSSTEYARAYLHAVSVMGGPVALGTDFNGFLLLPRPRYGPDGCGIDPSAGGTHYPFAPLVPPPAGAPRCPAQGGCGCVTQGGLLETCTLGPARHYDVNVDGLPHVGLLPDYLEDVRTQFEARYVSAVGVDLDTARAWSQQDLEPMMKSADAYVRAWDRLERVAAGATAPVAARPLPAVPSSIGKSLRAPMRLESAGTPGVARTLASATDVDFFDVQLDRCSTIELEVLHDGGAPPSIDVLDAHGNTITGRAKHVGKALRLERTLGRVHLRVQQAGNKLSPGPLAASYRPVFRVVASHDAGVEVCDGIDNDCNGKVDDCPTCVDTDGDGIADCVDPDDDDDCVPDEKDNCPLIPNANALCPQAKGYTGACNRCRPLPAEAEHRIVDAWLRRCALSPPEPGCRTKPCEAAASFGAPQARFVGELVAHRERGALKTLDTVLGPHGGFDLGKVKRAPNEPTAPCRWSSDLEHAASSMRSMWRAYDDCRAREQAFVDGGFCQAAVELPPGSPLKCR